MGFTKRRKWAIEWVLLSGSNIPDWFSYKIEGSSVSLWVDQRSCSKLKEIAICAVLELELEGSSVDLRDFCIQIDVKVNGYTKVLRFQTDSNEVSDDVILFGKTLYELGPSTPIHDRCYIEASIQTDDNYYSVKKCGIHLIMEKEEEDPPVRCVQRILSSNRTAISSSNNNIISARRIKNVYSRKRKCEIV
ncbi:hypothetical protein F0562_022512 [Nyssa sinensis]|uniref:C-JID domain-containing protein n=1 Tax=Nyssa sinensis TaxID=561372 RepID=A0A5J5BNT3_9ASTE|nr:hypothetical protein F0562_022512 [Nyssa sinensis]